MLFTEWNQEKALEVRYREGFEEGYREGFEKGYREGMEIGIEKGQKEVIDLLRSGTSLEEVIRLYEKNEL